MNNKMVYITLREACDMDIVQLTRWLPERYNEWLEQEKKRIQSNKKRVAHVVSNGARRYALFVNDMSHLQLFADL